MESFRNLWAAVFFLGGLFLLGLGTRRVLLKTLTQTSDDVYRVFVPVGSACALFVAASVTVADAQLNWTGWLFFGATVSVSLVTLIAAHRLKPVVPQRIVPDEDEPQV